MCRGPTIRCGRVCGSHPAELAADVSLREALRVAVAAQLEGSLPLELDPGLDTLDAAR